MSAWVVNANRSGFLPDHDPNEYDTFDDAANAAFEVIEWLNHDNRYVAYDDWLIDAQNRDTPVEGDVLLVSPDDNTLRWEVTIARMHA